MAPLISPLLAALTGRGRASSRCLVCHQVVGEGEPRVRVPGGGHVHGGCATYSMRVRPPRPATD